MRLFLFLSAALVAVLDAAPPHNWLAETVHYTMVTGFPDGTIITFYIKHRANYKVGGSRQSVRINFYEEPSVSIYPVHDISAHLRIDRDDTYPVESATFINGEWLGVDGRREQPLDEEPPVDGWWRVDVYKHDSFTLDVYFQGYWSGPRKFMKNLDNVKSVYVVSDFVDMDNVQIRIKLPNSNIAPMSSFIPFWTDEGKKLDRALIFFPNFPVGAHIEMTTILRASGGAKYSTPSLVFKSRNGHGNNSPFKIFQIWEGSGAREQLWIAQSDMTYDNGKKAGTLCTSKGPHGDLQHLYLQRIARDKLRLRVFYKPSNGAEGVYCEHTIPSEYALMFDGPFDIISHDGALILHLDHSVPRSVVIKKDD